MSLTSAMFTGISGLLSHGDQMNVLGNNIANVSTVGFKGARMDFEDFISQDVNTSAGIAQIGRGVAVGAIYSDFSQGSFQSTTEATDLGIGGRGFFAVKVPNEETTYYTRAGNFRFDKDGYLVDPHGYVLQGWGIETQSPSVAGAVSTTTSTASAIKGSGVPKDIQIEGFTADPQHTTNVTVITNLDARDGGDNSSSTTDKFFSLFEKWNGQDTVNGALGQSAYEYQNTIKIYDEGGTSHNLSVYFDQVTVSNSGGTKYWEYMVAINPLEDNRTINGVALNSSAAAGVLMIGTLTFDSTGQLTDQSAFVLKSSASITAASNFKSLSNWGLTSFSTNGYPMFVANFSGQTSASVVGASNARHMEFSVGLRDKDNTWVSSVSNASQITSNAGLLPSFGSSTEKTAFVTTSYSGSSSTLFQSQNGYTFGFLQNFTVDRDGILKGRYSNGQVLEMFQITLYDFTNKTGLNREGGNLFSKTTESGEAFPGPANANGNGSISSNSLELSNVDLAREFVGMITSQRGFQANSKVITTTDSMLAEVIALKR